MNDIYHSGVAHDDGPPGRGSGRYGWGTGENPHQHQFDFLSEVARLRAKGIKDSEIAKMLLGERAKLVDLRAEETIAKAEQRKINRARAIEMYDKCNGNMSEAARRLGMKNESSLRSLLDPVKAERRDRYQATADMLKEIVDEKGIVDIGKDSQLYLGTNCPRYTMDVAVSMLKKEGYLMTYVKVPQLGTNHETNIKVLAKPGTTWSEVQQNKYNIQPITTFTPDEGKSWWTPEFPESIDSKRVMIRYAEDGGKEKDGVIELRRGVEDISLGGSQYAQVRIAVDGTNYMKGMAIYGDVPDGYDIVYNTNKKRGTPAIDKNAVYNPEDGTWSGKEVMKRMKIDSRTGEVDRENPFGALIKSPKDKDGVVTAGGQRKYIGADGKEHLSPINKLQDEGDWDTWSKTLSSQFLSKQPEKLIKQQIDLSVADKRAELDTINKLTNPVVKKKLLEDFAQGCDSNANDLSVRGFKDQAFQVLIPIPELKDNEIYAPNYEDGDVVSLVRFPHGGIFEIPSLVVNNKNVAAKKVLQGASDAVGINANVAEVLSGADFDGDTAIVIPTKSNRLDIRRTDPLPELKGFDPKELYKLPDDAPQVKNKTKQTEMGKVTNLITDMTVGGANNGEIARAVKHSMVVIDSEKHHLDYKQSYKDNGVASLKEKYQGVNPDTGRVKGASTILSRASAEVYIDRRKELTDTKKMTPEQLKAWNEGKIVWIPDDNAKKTVQITDPSKMTEGELKIYNAGKKVYRKTSELRQEKVPQMATVDDARLLVRNPDNKKEMLYADYANDLKSLANAARKEARSIKPVPVDLNSKKTYAKEVERLEAALHTAKLNNPKERQAQTIANSIASERIKSNPDMDYEHRKREEARALNQARAIVGAKKERIVISDREWEAIQAHAISTSKLMDIINNTDLDDLKKRAMPRTSGNTLSDAQIAKAKAMYASGMYTQKEIADALGVSTSTVSKAVKS